MTATALKPRDFNSYFQEYMLLTSEMEINAYWHRMDKVVANMSEDEKRSFFKQLDDSLQQDLNDSRKLRATIEAELNKKSETGR